MEVSSNVIIIFLEARHGAKSDGVRRMVDITRDKPIKVSIRVAVPVRDHPKVCTRDTLFTIKRRDYLSYIF